MFQLVPLIFTNNGRWAAIEVPPPGEIDLPPGGFQYFFGASVADLARVLEERNAELQEKDFGHALPKESFAGLCGDDREKILAELARAWAEELPRHPRLRPTWDAA